MSRARGTSLRRVAGAARWAGGRCSTGLLAASRPAKTGPGPGAEWWRWDGMVVWWWRERRVGTSQRHLLRQRSRDPTGLRRGRHGRLQLDPEGGPESAAQGVRQSNTLLAQGPLLELRSRWSTKAL